MVFKKTFISSDFPGLSVIFEGDVGVVSIVLDRFLVVLIFFVFWSNLGLAVAIRFSGLPSRGLQIPVNFKIY